MYTVAIGQANDKSFFSRPVLILLSRSLLLPHHPSFSLLLFGLLLAIVSCSIIKIQRQQCTSSKERLTLLSLAKKKTAPNAYYCTSAQHFRQIVQYCTVTLTSPPPMAVWGLRSMYVCIRRPFIMVLPYEELTVCSRELR